MALINAKDARSGIIQAAQIHQEAQRELARKAHEAIEGSVQFAYDAATKPGFLLANLPEIIGSAGWGLLAGAGGGVIGSVVGGRLAGKGAPIPREPKPVTGTNPEAYLNEALGQQGLSEIPPAGQYKQKWSEGGFDYEVRAHPAEQQHGKTGTIYRVQRRKQGTDANGQGSGWEYMDEDGKWHPERTLKPGKPNQPNPTYNDAAARGTHIEKK